MTLNHFAGQWKFTGPALLVILVLAVPGVAEASRRQSQRSNSGNTAGTPGGETLLCQPSDSVTSATPAPAPTSTPAPAPSASPPAPTGYPIAVASDQTAEGVMAAVIYYATAPTGRTPIAGFADVAKVTPSDSSVALELKSTDQSPFRFDLTVGPSQSGNASRDATLIIADLFSDGTLSSVPYKCSVRGQ